MYFLLVVCVLSVVDVLSISPPTLDEHVTKLLTRKFPTVSSTDGSAHHAHHKRASFKQYYVTPGSFSKSPSSNSIVVDATHSVSDSAHYRAAKTISLLVKYMPYDVYHRLITNGVKVGVFTKAEGLTVFPEYYGLADKAGCHSSCSGSCAASCTFDGRKYSSLAGTGGQRTAVVDDNVLCNSADPYHRGANELVHEFAHTVMRYGVDSYRRREITNAYNHARSARLWTAGVYAMQTEEEYWAEGSQVFFNVEHLSYTTGGMNTCGGGSYCTSELGARGWLGYRDIQLFNLLQYVWTNNRNTMASGLSICMT